MNPSPTLAPADALARIIDALYRVVAAQSLGGRLAGPLIILICRRLNRFKFRFAALAARVQNGTHAPRRRKAAGAARPRKPPDPAERLPTRFGWLVRLAQPTVIGGGHLAILLADPDMVALIGAAPQAGRILRPLCRMLGLQPPAILQRQPTAAPAEPPAPAPVPPSLPPASLRPAPTPAPVAAPPPRRRAPAPGVPHPGQAPPLPA